MKHEEASAGGEHYENSDDPEKVHLKMPQNELISIPVTKPNGKASTVFWWNLEKKNKRFVSKTFFTGMEPSDMDIIEKTGADFFEQS